MSAASRNGDAPSVHGRFPMMLDSTMAIAILAQTPNFFDGGLIMDPRWLILIASVLVIGLSASSIIRWVKTRHLRSAPLMAFHQIASELGVSLSDQWLLHRVASQQLLPSPVTLLLSPATFDHHARSFVAAQPEPARPAADARLQAIRQRIFA